MACFAAIAQKVPPLEPADLVVFLFPSTMLGEFCIEEFWFFIHLPLHLSISQLFLFFKTALHYGVFSCVLFSHIR